MKSKGPGMKTQKHYFQSTHIMSKFEFRFSSVLNIFEMIFVFVLYIPKKMYYMLYIPYIYFVLYPIDSIENKLIPRYIS